jgi:hypothetical protein
MSVRRVFRTHNVRIVLEGREKAAKQSKQLVSCTRGLYLSKSQIPQDRTIPLGRALICATSSRPASARIRQKIISSDRSLGNAGNGMRGDKRTSYIQVCSFVTLTFTYKWSFHHWALQAACTCVRLSKTTTSIPLPKSREYERARVFCNFASTCPTKTRELWITDCATLGRCVPARLPCREHYSPWNILRRRKDESYRTGACRRLCIRRGGRQPDEAIA